MAGQTFKIGMAALEVPLDAGEVDPLGKMWRLAGDTVNGFGCAL